MQTPSSSPPYDEREIRCPKLGGQVTFDYCRIENGDLPCSRAILCWSVFFDVGAFFCEVLTPDEFKRAFAAASRPKVVTLIELIEKAREAARQNSNR
jgi:hypothetical protein